LRHPIRLTLLLLCALSLLLTGCGTVTKRPDVDDVDVATESSRMYEMVVGRDQQMLRRLSNLSTPLLIGNADLCDSNTRFIIALKVANIEDYRGHKRDAMQAVYELDDRIQVLLVGREGPAHIAGLREGDIILAVNDIETPKGMSASSFFKLHVAPLVESGKPIKFTILRKTQRISAYVQPVLACDYPVRLKVTGDVNAYANGNSIVVYSGLLNIFPEDEEVGVVIAHELAHNIMGHIEKKTMELWSYTYLAKILNSASNSNGGSIYANMEYLKGSVDYEYEADYVGLYLAARAGLEIDQAPTFLRRLAMDSPGAIDRDSTHPQYAARFVAQESAIAEIHHKMALGKPLVPEFKTDAVKKKSMKDGVLPITFRDMSKPL